MLKHHIIFRAKVFLISNSQFYDQEKKSMFLRRFRDANGMRHVTGGGGSCRAGSGCFLRIRIRGWKSLDPCFIFSQRLDFWCIVLREKIQGESYEAGSRSMFLIQLYNVLTIASKVGSGSGFLRVGSGPIQIRNPSGKSINVAPVLNYTACGGDLGLTSHWFNTSFPLNHKHI